MMSRKKGEGARLFVQGIRLFKNIHLGYSFNSNVFFSYLHQSLGEYLHLAEKRSKGGFPLKVWRGSLYYDPTVSSRVRSLKTAFTGTFSEQNRLTIPNHNGTLLGKPRTWTPQLYYIWTTDYLRMLPNDFFDSKKVSSLKCFGKSETTLQTCRNRKTLENIFWWKIFKLTHKI